MRARTAALTLIGAALLVASFAFHVTRASADGDPGSDVLVNQNLFFEPDSNISIAQQEKLGVLLAASSGAGFPVRVAIVAAPQDLGAVTALWRQPQAYARFLGIELSDTYSGRLLVVMPNGFGFNWPGHSAASAYRVLSSIPIRADAAGWTVAVESAVRSLASAAKVTIHPSNGAASPASQTVQQSVPASAPSPVAQTSAPTGAGGSGSSLDKIAADIVAALIAGSVAVLLIHQFRKRRPAAEPRSRRPLREHLPRPRAGIAIAGTCAILAGGAVVALALVGPPHANQGDPLATNPYLDPGTPLGIPAPTFTLTDQFGRPVSLRSYRGKVVLLAFNDSECTTICPLTTTAMLDAKAMLGRAGANLQLLGIDANPKATSLEDVFSYSQLHGMLGAWHFLTGTLPALQHVWNAYKIQAAVEGGEIAHTPALFVIDPQGRERELYMTQQSYAAVGQLGQLLAKEASRLMPGHPTVNSHLSYAQISGISPTTSVNLPGAGGGSVHFGPDRAHVYVFFATWDRQITGLGAGLEGLARYSALARKLGLPGLTAVDEASVEPPGALRGFLSTLSRPLPYPIALDRTGQLADGYEVQGLPWVMVVSGRGQISWYYSVAALGWPSTSYLIAHVRDALVYAAGAPRTLSAALARLAGSPPPLAAVHHQASQLLGHEPALAARIRALRGYPVVVNVWASWCVPCQSEFGLFQSASARYGTEVAFLGADTEDSAANARTFLHQHPVSYPSYQTSIPSLTGIVPQGIAGLPTTLFFDRSGKLVYVHSGQYDTQGILDADIQAYAFGG